MLENLPGKMASVDAGCQAGQKVQAGVASAAGAGQGSQVLQPANWQISPFCNPQLPDVAGVWDGRGRRTLQNCFRIAVEKGTQPSRESFLQRVALVLFWILILSCCLFLARAETKSTQALQGGERSESVPSRAGGRLGLKEKAQLSCQRPFQAEALFALFFFDGRLIQAFYGFQRRGGGSPWDGGVGEGGGGGWR